MHIYTPNVAIDGDSEFANLLLARRDKFVVATKITFYRHNAGSITGSQSWPGEVDRSS